MIRMKNKEILNVWLSDTPSLSVLEIYIKEAKKRKYDYIYFDAPIPLEYGLSRIYFYLKVK